jgi:hypothetical protein
MIPSLAGEGGERNPESTPTQSSPRRLCHNWGYGEKCHAELVSASNKINSL